MVQTTSHIFSGKVDIESNLLVGSSHLFVDTTNNRVGITTPDPDASLHVNGNVYVESNVGVGSTIELDGDTGIITATGFVGDASQLTGLASNLEQVVNNGNVASATVEFSNPGTSLVASGNVDVVGNVTALKFIGDGSGLTGVAANLQAITDNGNVTSNTVQFTNTGTSLTASGDVEVSGALRVGGVDVALSSDLDSNALRISNLETSNGYIWSNLADNASRISNLETSNGHIWSNLADNASRISNLESSNTQIFGDLATLSAADIVQEDLITGLGDEIDSNAARISNLETSNGYIWSNLADNVSRISNLETSNGYIWSNLADNASRISNLETSNGHIWSNLADNASRISNLETSNGHIWSNLADNTSRISNLETSNGYIWSNLADNTSRISNLETSNGHIWSNLADNTSRISNLETSNGYLWSNLGIVSDDLADNVTRIQNLETATGGTALSLQNITDIGNATTNVVRFTNTATGLITTANIEVGGNVKIDGLTVGAVPYVAADNFLKESFISTTTDTTVIASNLDVTGNIFMRGERFIVESETKLINDAIIGIANNNTTATTDVGILIQRPTANVALIHHGGTDKFTIGYTQNNLTATDITNDTANVINVNILGELYVQNNVVLGSSGKYYGDGSTLTNVPTSTDHTALTNRVGSIETVLGGSAPTFPKLNLDGVIERGNTTSNTILLTNATTGIVADGNVEALNFIGDGTSLTGLSLQHITELGNVTTSNIQAAYFKGDGSELTNITLDNVVNKGNATSNVIHLTNVTKGLEADGNIHASFFIGDGSKLTNVDLDTVVNKGNATSNTVQFTNTGTSLTASGNVVIDGNVSSTTAFVSNVATMGTTKTFVVTANGGYFYIDGVDRPALELHEHQTYIFDVSSLSAGGHVFRLSTTVQGTHGGGSEYTDGVDLSVANKLILTVQTGAPDLYYYCTTSGHSSMGNTQPCKVYSTAELIVSGRIVTSGNVDVMSNVNVVGNVYANSFVGDGAGLTNVPTVSTLQDVTTNGPSTSQAIQLTNTGTSLTASGGITAAYFTGDGSNVAIGEMTATTIPYVDSNKRLRDSHITHLANKTIINSNLEIEGNLFVTGNTFAVNSENMVVNDRIIGIANNNTVTNLDMGLIMQYPQKNVAVIHHGTVSGSPHNSQFTIGYTQNSVTSNNITQDTNNDITLNVWGSIISSNYFGDGTTLTGVALSNATIISNSAGITSGFAKGDLLYASATNTLANLAIGGTTGHVLKVSSDGIPEWAAETGGSGSGSSQWTGTNEVYFDGNVGIANTNPVYDLNVGSNLFVDDDGSNVLVVDGNVSATKYYGDGSALTGISSSGGGQWVGTNEVYFDGNVGIANTNPVYDLNVGSNLFVDDDGSNVLVVDGNVSASYFVGDGSRLTGISSSGGGQWVGTNEVYFDGNVGIANTDPGHDLSVGSNLFVDDDGSNVLVISGNAAMTALTLGEVSIAVSYGLDDILNTSNISSNTIQLTEQTTGLVATGNVQALKFIGDGSELTNIASNLDQIVNNGNVTSNTVQFSNAITSLTAASNVVVTGNVTAGSFLGDGSELTALNAANIGSGTLPVARGGTGTTSSTGSGALVLQNAPAFTGDATFDTNTLKIDASNNRVGIGTSTPGQKLSIYTGSTGTAALSFDRSSSDNYRTDIYQDQYGADFRVGYGSYTPESVLYLKRLSNGTKRVVINDRLGIGETDPEAALDIGSGGARIHGTEITYNYNASYAYASLTGTASAGTWQSDPGNANYGLYVQNWIRCTAVTLISDARIKKNIVDINDTYALDKLRQLQPKYYNYIDTISEGEQRVIGFIAQEVKDVIPEAVKITTDFIPNIYELSNVSDSNVITLTNFDTSTLESNVMVLKVYDIENKEHLVNIAEVIDGHSIRVEEDLSEWIGSFDESGNVVAGNHLFVYGQKVTDFNNLNKNCLWTYSTAALQEVDRQLQAEKVKVASLETQLTSVLARLDALENA
jgi:hypothetical protein